MSSQEYSPDQFVPAVNGSSARPGWLATAAGPSRLWLHTLLLALTLVTTTVVGARLALNFERNLPAFEFERELASLAEFAANPWLILRGLAFSITLVGILLAHEIGHYLACRFYRIDATLPYFIPAPTFIGTFGAFIRIRSPIYSKRILFDIGIAGPLAGFLLLLPALAIGLAYSKIIPGIADQGDLVFGTPPLVWLLQTAIFPGVDSTDIYMHPVARAAWVGILATSLNLLPIGQLDGGHILYALAGDRHRLVSRVFVAALVPVGFFFWYGWLVWIGLFLVFGLRHPPTIYDPEEVRGGRVRLGWLALLILILTFTLAPFRAGGGL